MPSTNSPNSDPKSYGNGDGLPVNSHDDPTSYDASPASGPVVEPEEVTPVDSASPASAPQSNGSVYSPPVYNTDDPTSFDASPASQP